MSSTILIQWSTASAQMLLFKRGSFGSKPVFRLLLCAGYNYGEDSTPISIYNDVALLGQSFQMQINSESLAGWRTKEKRPIDIIIAGDQVKKGVGIFSSHQVRT